MADVVAIGSKDKKKTLMADMVAIISKIKISDGRCGSHW